MKSWKKLSPLEIRKAVFGALKLNVDYYESTILGVPASHLDQKVFYQDAPFLANAPYLSTLIHNPNHIGCHTLGSSESFFKGTQELEREVIRLCANDILKGEGEFDGYIASGGTEANLQAIWIYRNYFMKEHNASLEDICILCSADSHYSMSKAANLLQIDLIKVAVDERNRKLLEPDLNDKIQQSNKKHFIVIANMMTTMFGSVDDVDQYHTALSHYKKKFMIHVDGAYGGFFYPFSAIQHTLDFANPKVNSVTLDAHKMLQAPYGTGIFLIRKDYMHYANTKDASYVEGEDYTLIGSRSGANAIAIWMILMTYGPHGWFEKILVLRNRTTWLCEQLSTFEIPYFREEGSNIVTIQASFVKDETAKNFGLVPDNHHAPKWYKVVVMEHVDIDHLENLTAHLKQH